MFFTQRKLKKMSPSFLSLQNITTVETPFTLLNIPCYLSRRLFNDLNLPRNMWPISMIWCVFFSFSRRTSRNRQRFSPSHQVQGPSIFNIVRDCDYGPLWDAKCVKSTQRVVVPLLLARWSVRSLPCCMTNKRRIYSVSAHFAAQLCSPTAPILRFETFKISFFDVEEIH